MKKYVINQIKLELSEFLKINENSELIQKISEKIAKKLKTNQKNIKKIKIIRKSIDSRKKSNIFYSFNIAFETELNLQLNEYNFVDDLRVPKLDYKGLSPVVVGSGPSGLFAALTLARMGVKPIVLEQGKKASDRARDVEAFWAGGKLNPKSNVQFGHGGAGTFSDGKLNTGINSKYINYVLNQYALFGAGEEITYSHAPHVGTDVLINVIENIKNEIIAFGGTILFEHEFLDYNFENNGESKKITGAIVEYNNKIFEIQTDKIILCIGNASRRTFRTLYEKGVTLQAKPISIGLRIQHNQAEISRAQYGENFGVLPPADYKLSHFLENGRCVYTFCNCPGGYVVNASSEPDGVVCNGMSYNDRAGKNANSALLVNVNVSDFASSSPLAGIEFQEKWERRAFEIAGGQKLPVQLLGDFINNQISAEFKSVLPACKGEITFADLNQCLPEFASKAIKEAVLEFDKKISGFARPDAILVGVETRSSSPVRIPRNENFETNITGLYSCGEGAGYAGGITSASIDGVRLALKIFENEED